MRDEMRSVLRSIALADLSRPYDHGEPRADGEMPGTGSRWMTPRELAERALREMGEA